MSLGRFRNCHFFCSHQINKYLLHTIDEELYETVLQGVYTKAGQCNFYQRVSLYSHYKVICPANDWI